MRYQKEETIKHNEVFIEFDKYNDEFFEYFNKCVNKPTFAEVNINMVNERKDDVIEWTEKNCEGYVLYVHGDEIFFEHKSEGVLFKMWLI